MAAATPNAFEVANLPTDPWWSEGKVFVDTRIATPAEVLSASRLPAKVLEVFINGLRDLCSAFRLDRDYQNMLTASVLKIGQTAMGMWNIWRQLKSGVTDMIKHPFEAVKEALETYAQERTKTVSGLQQKIEYIFTDILNTALNYIHDILNLSAPLAVINLAEYSNEIDVLLETTPANLITTNLGINAINGFFDYTYDKLNKEYETNLRPFIPESSSFRPIFEMCFRDIPTRFLTGHTPEDQQKSKLYANALKKVCKMQIQLLTVTHVMGASEAMEGATALGQNFVAVSSFMHGILFALENHYSSAHCGNLRSLLAVSTVQSAVQALIKEFYDDGILSDNGTTIQDQMSIIRGAMQSIIDSPVVACVCAENPWLLQGYAHISGRHEREVRLTGTAFSLSRLLIDWAIPHLPGVREWSNPYLNGFVKSVEYGYQLSGFSKFLSQKMPIDFAAMVPEGVSDFSAQDVAASYSIELSRYASEILNSFTETKILGMHMHNTLGTASQQYAMDLSDGLAPYLFEAPTETVMQITAKAFAAGAEEFPEWCWSYQDMWSYKAIYVSGARFSTSKNLFQARLLLDIDADVTQETLIQIIEDLRTFESSLPEGTTNGMFIENLNAWLEDINKKDNLKYGKPIFLSFRDVSVKNKNSDFLNWLHMSCMKVKTRSMMDYFGDISFVIKSLLASSSFLFSMAKQFNYKKAAHSSTAHPIPFYRLGASFLFLCKDWFYRISHPVLKNGRSYGRLSDIFDSENAVTDYEKMGLIKSHTYLRLVDENDPSHEWEYKTGVKNSSLKFICVTGLSTKSEREREFNLEDASKLWLCKNGKGSSIDFNYQAESTDNMDSVRMTPHRAEKPLYEFQTCGDNAYILKSDWKVSYPHLKKIEAYLNKQLSTTEAHKKKYHIKSRIDNVRFCMLLPAGKWTLKGMAKIFCLTLKELMGMMPRAQDCKQIMIVTEAFQGAKPYNGQVSDVPEDCIEAAIEGFHEYKGLCGQFANCIKGETAETMIEKLNIDYGVDPLLSESRFAADDTLSDEDYVKKLIESGALTETFWESVSNLVNEAIKGGKEVSDTWTQSFKNWIYAPHIPGDYKQIRDAIDKVLFNKSSVHEATTGNISEREPGDDTQGTEANESDDSNTDTWFDTLEDQANAK